MYETEHIVHVYNKTTKRKKNAKPPKTSPNQTSQRPTRPDHPAIPKNPVHARLPGDNQDKKELWSVFWAQHYLSVVGFFGEEGTGE